MAFHNTAIQVRNDPPRLIIDFSNRRRGARDDTALAQALAENPSVTQVILCGLGSRWAEDNDATFPALCRELATPRANFPVVWIDEDEFEDRTAPAAFMRQFLQALIENPSVSFVDLRSLKIYTEDLASLLRAQRWAPMSLCLFDVIVEPLGPNASVADLTEAMKSSKSIKSLQFHYHYSTQGDAAQAILTGLSTNQSVETLRLNWGTVMGRGVVAKCSKHFGMHRIDQALRFDGGAAFDGRGSCGEFQACCYRPDQE